MTLFHVVCQILNVSGHRINSHSLSILLFISYTCSTPGSCWLKEEKKKATDESVVLFINHHVWQMMWRQHVLESHTTPHRWSHNTFTSHLNSQRSSWRPEVTWMTSVKLYIVFVMFTDQNTYFLKRLIEVLNINECAQIHTKPHFAAVTTLSIMLYYCCYYWCITV